MQNWLRATFRSIAAQMKLLQKSGLLFLLMPFFVLIAVGTLVYSRLENWTLLDSLYATIITITTVGYGDLTPQSPWGRVFAIVFTLFAIALAGYALSTVGATLFERQRSRLEIKRLKRRMNKIAELSNHIIICGASTLGNRAANEFYRRGFKFVIIEQDAEKLKRALLWMYRPYVEKRQSHFEELAEVDWSVEEQMTLDQLADETGICYMLENPIDEQQIRAAGIHCAYGVVATMEDDRDNTTIVLSARDMGRRLGNEKLRIVASAGDELNMHTLYLAGADRVISPRIMGGFMMASNMLDHQAAEYWDEMTFQMNAEVRFGDLNICDYPHLIGRTVAEVRTDLSQLVVAIRRDGHFINIPANDEIVQANDVLIVVGPDL